MNDQERLDLSKLLQKFDGEETTDKIRNLKHSNKILADVMEVENLKKKYNRIKTNDFNKFKNICQHNANFLYTYYTNIFIRLIKDELDIQILCKFIIILQKIENGELDQHEASVIVGKILKELYIDSSIRQNNKREKKDKKDKKGKKNKKNNKEKNVNKNISWKEYKKNIEL